MNSFADVNGKTIVPGCIVVVATKRSYGGAVLRKGRVSRTQLGGSSRWNRDSGRPQITLRDIDKNRYMGTYRRLEAVMVVEE